MDAEPIIFRPDPTIGQIETMSERIVKAISDSGSVDVVGLSSSVFLACSAINRIRRFANVNVKSLILDYIEIPVIGKFDGIFFQLTNESVEDDAKQMANFETQLGSDQYLRTVSVSKNDRPEKLTNIALMKVNSFPVIKIASAGAAINAAVSIALQISKTNISKHKVGIMFVGLGSIKNRIDENKLTTALNIYLQRDAISVTNPHHQELVERITKGR